MGGSHRRWIAAVLVIAMGAAGAYALRAQHHENAPEAARVADARVAPGPRVTQPAGQESPAPAPSGNAVGAAAPQGADRAAALRDALAWTDDAQRIGAIEAVMNAGAVETLPVLEGVELKSDPEASPTIIHAVSVLGKQTRGSDQRQAVQTLGRWLHEESGRVGADARGNVSVLIDALGDLGSHEAAQALADSLDDDGLPLHVQTLAVQRLTDLGDPVAKAAIDRFSARVAGMPPLEGIDDALRTEALAVANTATDRFQP